MNQKIEELIEESIKFSPDSKRDNEIIYLLKQIDNFEALEIIKNMVDRKSLNIYYIAGKVLNERKVVEPFFIFGLTKADATSIKLWLEFAIPRIGLKRVIKALKISENENPGIIDKALYWMPNLVKNKDIYLIEELKKWWK